jgi:hypothetical protein
MRLWIVTTAALAVASGAAAQAEHWVNPYVRSDGTYVQGHMQTNPNGTRADNWSTKGNTNPYTGQPGTKPLYPSTPTYGAPSPSYFRTPAPTPGQTPYNSSYRQRPSGSSYGDPPN